MRSPAIAADVPAGDLPWPDRALLAMALFAGCVGVVLALERHEFTHPNLRWIAIVLAVGPWVLAALPITKRCFGSNPRSELLLHLAWCASVLAGASWLVVTYSGTDDFAPFVAALLIGQMSADAGWRFGGAVWLVTLVILFTFIATEPTYGMWIWAFAFTIGLMGGVAFGRQVRIAYLLTQAQSQLAQRAVEEERHRLARDVHDLVAHSLAVTMLQLSGARLALRDGETAEAIEALEQAESAGRSAMAEIHRTVGLLGSGSGSSMSAPTPCAADLPALVGDFQRAGLAVDFELRGDLASVPLTIGLASYRLVQESLSNAVKHAPGAPVRLRVDVQHDAIAISAVNPVVAHAVAGPAGGNGLRGMAERAEMLGGLASAGNGDGTWKVDASIPWGDPPS